MNMKTAWNYTYKILIFLLSVGIIFEVHNLFHFIDKEQKEETFSFPYNSFAYINVELTFTESMTLPLPDEFPGSINSRGSGMVIGTTTTGNSAILTANHVCNPPPFSAMGWAIGFDKKITITDFHGNKYNATIVMTDLSDDLCVLEAEDMNIDGVPFSRQEPTIGKKVYTVAAPMAFFSPGMVPMFEGYYSGDIFSSQGLDSVYAIPAKEGSSGSSVLNEDGEIIGVVHSSISGLENIAISSTYPEVKAFLYEFENLFGGTLSH